MERLVFLIDSNVFLEALLVFSQLSFSTLPLQRGSCRLQVPFRASEHSTVPRSEPFPSGATHTEVTLINLPDNVLVSFEKDFDKTDLKRIEP